MMEPIKKRTQIAFNIEPEIRNQIKIVAIKRNISMNLWIMRAIYIALSKEEGPVSADPKQKK